MQITQALTEVFGYSNFRDSQERVIAHVLAGGDALVLMPTGGGKSLCYQIPAVVSAGVTLVVSPLIALMEDQVQALRQLGVEAHCLNSAISQEDHTEALAGLRSGRCKLLYVAPERLLKPEFLGFLEQFRLSLIAIDEAHCISQWGHDFRPEYAQLSILRERFPGVPRLALTATADEQTRRDIIRFLQLDDALVCVSSFDRPNIRYEVGLKNHPVRQLLTFLNVRHKGDSGIVYCLSRKRVETVSCALNDNGFQSYPYHAGMEDTARKRNQEIFSREEGVVMVATIAFGMGINKSNVRFVAHLDLPKSLESYYQETGRAGRDGLPASAWMVYGLSDIAIVRQWIETSTAAEQVKRVEMLKLNALLAYAETTECRRSVLLQYFGEDYPIKCGNCDVCLHPVETWDGKLRSQQALSVAYRTGQRFGVTHLVDVLMGRTNQRIKDMAHDKLAVFGIGADLPAAEWKGVFRQLVAKGCLRVDLGGFGGLSLTEQSRVILKGEQEIRFRRDRFEKEKTLKVKKERGAKALTTVSSGLFEELRALRLSLAKAAKIPPYLIFHDSTLVEMADASPKTVEEFARINGVGVNKMKRYAEAFLSVINQP